jgi:hypothetical protein
MRRQLTGVCLALCLSASAARAQGRSPTPIVGDESRVEGLAGVTLAAPQDVNQPPQCHALSLPCLTPRTAPDFGVALPIAWHVTHRFVLVGEAAVSANAWDAFQTNCLPAGRVTPPTCPGSEVDHIRSALAGLRVQTARLSYGAHDPVRLFGQVLVGPEWSSVVPRQRAVQPGGGVDIYLRSGMRIRLEGDYRFVPGGLRDLSTSRILIGIVFPVG